jgi:hypothetical protein
MAFSILRRGLGAGLEGRPGAKNSFVAFHYHTNCLLAGLGFQRQQPIEPAH